MEALILLADGFEESEALITHDILTRSRCLEPVLCSISDHLEVTSSMGLEIKANALLSQIDLSRYQIVILPGGKKGVENLLQSEAVRNLIASHKENKRHVHAICAAPSILGKLGYLETPYTCYPGFETIPGCTGKGVEKAGFQITGKGMGFTTEFALEIVGLYGGEEEKARVEASIKGN